jgi:tetratricopeptide (TPR) repeat protein
LSSKLRKLKQQAYEAGKKRDWSAAMEAYAQILELDKNNPSLLNEYGDICLKAGDVAKAIRQFLAAASKYRGTGLLNNAQAVYKKVLRHDGDNLNANWYLAEIRAAQGLMAEGEVHALRVLAAADDVSGDFKEIFLKRCQELLGLYPEREAILDRLIEVFRLWDMPLESSRAGCLRAVRLQAAGETEAAAEMIRECVERNPEIVNYGEYARWLEATGCAGSAQSTVDVNTIALDDDPGSVAVPAPCSAPEDATTAPPDASGAVAPDTAEAPDPETSFASLDLGIETPEPGTTDETAAETSFASLADEASPAEPPAAAAVPHPQDPAAPARDTGVTSPADDLAAGFERDDEGCITIEGDESASFADLMDDLAGLADAATAAPESAPAADAPAAEGVAGDGRQAGGGDGLGACVNLLDEILAEEGEDILRSTDSEQVSTIASEIGRNLGDAGQPDPEAQYQQGLVYLELGMHDQAALAFSAAARSDRHALQARELWGIALQRDGQTEEALAVFLEGLSGSEPGNRLVLGLHYHAGCILQDLGRGEEAQEHFRQVYEVDAGFADVARRLRTPVA